MNQSPKTSLRHSELRFRDKQRRVVSLKKAIKPAHWADNFEDSRWVATGAVKMTYSSLRRAYQDLALAGFHN